MTLEKRQPPARSAPSSSPNRRGFLARSAVALSVSLFVFASNHAKTMTTSDTYAIVVAAAPAAPQATEGPSIHPFTVQVYSTADKGWNPLHEGIGRYVRPIDRPHCVWLDWSRVPRTESRGEHKVLIEAVDPEGRVLTAQTVTFKSPGK